MGATQALAELETFLGTIKQYEDYRLKILNQQLMTRRNILAELKKRGR